MDPERYDRLQRIFHDAVDLPEPARQAFLARECGADLELAGQVRKMIEIDAHPGQMLDRDVGFATTRCRDGRRRDRAKLAQPRWPSTLRSPRRDLSR